MLRRIPDRPCRKVLICLPYFPMKSTQRSPAFESAAVLVTGMGVREVQHWAAAAVGDRLLLKQFVDIAIGDRETAGQKAAWVLAHAVARKPDIAQPFFTRIADALEQAVGGRLRELFKVLLHTCRGEQQHAVCIGWSFRLLSQRSSDIAVMNAAKGFLEKACGHYPDLAEEFAWHLESVAALHGRPWQQQVQKTRERLQRLRSTPRSLE